MLVGVLLRLTHRQGAADTGIAEPVEGQAGHGEFCCGTHEVCEKINSRRLDPVEYFDDEELDRFKGRGESDYNDSEVEEFREVMMTMQPAEVALWSVSLEKRGVKVPSCLRDEMMMLIYH